MRWTKWVGLAGVVGIAATGVLIARSERQRRVYTAEEIRARLHERLAGAGRASLTIAGRSPHRDEGR